MSGKTISTGTLGLRFMQNAQRAKQLKEVEAERAHVKDDGEWEVDQAVRDAWGASGSSSSSQTVTHETSYLPFLFPSLSDNGDPSTVNKSLKGRRVFNKNGEEVVQETVLDSGVIPQGEDKAISPSVAKKSKIHPHPTSISSSSGTLLNGFPKEVKSTKTAKEAIYDTTGVGTDLRTKSTHSIAGFLKPSGVDEPLAPKLDNGEPRTGKTPKLSGMRSSGDTLTGSHTESDIIPGARSKQAKRQRSTVDQAGGEGMKRKKKTKSDG